jgi:tRNA (adenine22-N1)-methyltransferase
MSKAKLDFLSERLQALFDQLVVDEPVWDFCCDHGLLGVAAYQSQKFPSVYFVDPVPEIIAALRIRFEQEFNSNQNPTVVEFLIQKGNDVERPVCGNVVIAGVGAKTIIGILAELRKRNLLEARRLIICPQNSVNLIEEWIRDALDGLFYLGAKKVVFERGRARTIFTFDRNIKNDFRQAY